MSTEINTTDLTAALRKVPDLSQSYISQLVTGRRTPSLALAFEIETHAGIPVAFWKDRLPRRAEGRLDEPQQKAAADA